MGILTRFLVTLDCNGHHLSALLKDFKLHDPIFLLNHLVLKTRKQKSREGKELAQRHTARKAGIRGGDPRLPEPNTRALERRTPRLTDSGVRGEGAGQMDSPGKGFSSSHPTPRTAVASGRAEGSRPLPATLQHLAQPRVLTCRGTTPPQCSVTVGVPVREPAPPSHCTAARTACGSHSTAPAGPTRKNSQRYLSLNAHLGPAPRAGPREVPPCRPLTALRDECPGK